MSGQIPPEAPTRDVPLHPSADKRPHGGAQRRCPGTHNHAGLWAAITGAAPTCCTTSVPWQARRWSPGLVVERCSAGRLRRGHADAASPPASHRQLARTGPRPRSRSDRECLHRGFLGDR